jgi:hypothetical protein
MYALFDDSGPNGIHLMDPWLDNPDPNFTLKYLKDNFNAHYTGKRQPFGLYTHPTHLATGYPGVKEYVKPFIFSLVLATGSSVMYFLTD